MNIKFLLFVFSISLFACSNAPTLESIQALAGQVYDEQSRRIDNDKAMEYVEACIQFAKANPENEESPKILLKAAETARNVNQFDKALGIYDIVMKDFASYEKAPQALFLKAFTLDDSMGKKDEAKVLYESFIKDHPQDEFVESAKFMLSNLYKSDEEIIKEFEQKREEQAVEQ